jgi:hypothetical protein
MNQRERSQALADWPSEKREVLVRKLDVYGKLEPAERERRLKMIELRYYLQPLMTNSAAERGVKMGKIPPALRGIIAQRLRQWDLLQPDVKEKILANEAAVNYFASIPPTPPSPPGVKLPETSESKASREHLKLWQSLSVSEREKYSRQFNQFFELPRDERVRALSTLSEAERQEMQSTLDAFAKLSPRQRALCIDSFKKFTRMSPAERNNFLKSAARWAAMTPEERETWKALVRELPPLPPIDPPPTPSVPELALTNNQSPKSSSKE